MENSIKMGDNTQSDLAVLAERLRAAYKAMDSLHRDELISRIRKALGGQSHYSVYGKILNGHWPNRQVEIAIRELEGMTNEN
ncbi:MAG: hypothetical protein J6M37_06350 [Prevotella sp.]|nr:hypothetical protein [Prevotella sp.]